eukprot:TRINITY_DN1538_c0_g1_i4.p1 TRINITY_DN1538_c0_g1~~TRINITY_DN1538_c0_g1_i4.p1  ORF type:complete len:458 (+),score=25.06 TRINITY_DN1538_c0_g1_i4:125-1498(+)
MDSCSSVPHMSDTTDDFAACFRLGEKLGQGQLGVVHACHCKVTGEIVGACKSISKEMLKSRALYTIVLSEIAAMKVICGHTNVLELKAVFEDDDAVHLIIDMCMGGDLFKHLSSVERLEESAAARLVQQILLGLQHCHNRGVVHRDVKPENILITHFSPSGPQGRSEPQIKLADFGFAALVNAGDSTSGFFGSPLYMAPEIIQHISYGPSVDVWSVGVILFTALCGFMPFYGSDSEVFAQVLQGDSHLDFQSSPWDIISPMAKDIVQRMLRKEPSERISIEEALRHPWIASHCSSHVVSRMDSLKDRLRRLRALRSSRSSRGQDASLHEQEGHMHGNEIDAVPCVTALEMEVSATSPCNTFPVSSHVHSKLFHNSPRSPFDMFFASPRAPSGPAAKRRSSFESLSRTNSSRRANSSQYGHPEPEDRSSSSASIISPSQSRREVFHYMHKVTSPFGRH